VVETLGVLVVANGLPATEAGRPSLDGAGPIEEGALGAENFAGVLLAGGAIIDDILVGEANFPTVLGRGKSLVSSMLIAEAGRDV